jgi:hypothetical protein
MRNEKMGCARPPTCTARRLSPSLAHALTESSSSGRRSGMTPAFCSVSTLAGRFAASATACTNCTRARWYVSKAASREADIFALEIERLLQRFVNPTA